MKIFKRMSFLVFLALSVVMTSCGSDDDGNPNDPTDPSGSQIENAGNPHTYEFTFTGGELDGETRSGAIADNFIITELLLANYSAYTNFNENGLKGIDLHIFNEDMIISGGLFYKNNQTRDFGEGNTIDFSDLRIQMESPNIKYSSKAGTIELTEIDFTNSLGINEVYAGLAAYKITFNGTFINFQNANEVNIKGTVKVNFPANVEQY